MTIELTAAERAAAEPIYENRRTDAGMSLADIEAEFRARGYRILYRRPDEFDIWAYQFERGGETMGFRMTEQMGEQALPEPFTTYIEKHWRLCREGLWDCDHGAVWLGEEAQRARTD